MGKSIAPRKLQIMTANIMHHIARMTDGHLFEEVHGDSSVPDAGELAGGVVPLPHRAQPVAWLRLVVLGSLRPRF